YHNGVNDDGARARRREKSRGRMMRHRGQVKLVTPGGKLLGNTHDLSTMGAMDLI
ncbi:MAG: HNH endonuclease signature motif containing protein, partial [Corynebacterium casei]